MRIVLLLLLTLAFYDVNAQWNLSFSSGIGTEAYQFNRGLDDEKTMTFWRWTIGTQVSKTFGNHQIGIGLTYGPTPYIENFSEEQNEMVHLFEIPLTYSYRGFGKLRPSISFIYGSAVYEGIKLASINSAENKYNLGLGAQLDYFFTPHWSVFTQAHHLGMGRDLNDGWWKRTGIRLGLAYTL